MHYVSTQEHIVDIVIKLETPKKIIWLMIWELFDMFNWLCFLLMGMFKYINGY